MLPILEAAQRFKQYQIVNDDLVGENEKSYAFRCAEKLCFSVRPTKFCGYAAAPTSSGIAAGVSREPRGEAKLRRTSKGEARFGPV